jgi:hypothetical protein
LLAEIDLIRQYNKADGSQIFGKCHSLDFIGRINQTTNVDDRMAQINGILTSSGRYYTGAAVNSKRFALLMVLMEMLKTIPCF